MLLLYVLSHAAACPCPAAEMVSYVEEQRQELPARRTMYEQVRLATLQLKALARQNTL